MQGWRPEFIFKLYILEREHLQRHQNNSMIRYLFVHSSHVINESTQIISSTNIEKHFEL